MVQFYMYKLYSESTFLMLKDNTITALTSMCELDVYTNG